jgi:2-methylcitrate dehydratase PrpD
LQEEHAIEPGQIERIEVWTFHEAVRLATRRPATTEEAQYSLPFPVAAMLQHGRLGPAELSGQSLHEKETLRLAERIELKEDDAYNEQFPGRRLARVCLTLRDGRRYQSPPSEAEWDADDPPDDAALQQKFRDLAGVMAPAARVERLLTLLWDCHRLSDVGELLATVARPLPPS